MVALPAIVQLLFFSKSSLKTLNYSCNNLFIILAVFPFSFHSQALIFLYQRLNWLLLFASTSIFSYGAAGYINGCREHEWMNELLSSGCTPRFSVELTKPLSLPHTLLFMDVCSGTPLHSHSVDPRDYDGPKPNPSTHTWPLSWLARGVSHLYSPRESWLKLLCVLASNTHTKKHFSEMLWCNFFFTGMLSHFGNCTYLLLFYFVLAKS